jgi:hypothetical protein
LALFFFVKKSGFVLLCATWKVLRLICMWAAGFFDVLLLTIGDMQEVSEWEQQNGAERMRNAKPKEWQKRR